MRRGQQVEILAGAYRDVEVEQGARLVLHRVSPGAPSAQCAVLAAAGLESRSVRWETLDRESRAGAEARLFGVLVAPEGEVELDHGAQVQGQVLAERIKAGPGVLVIAPPGGGGGGGSAQTIVVVYQMNAVSEYTWRSAGRARA